MSEAYRHLWQPWEGRTVDGVFALARFLGGTGRAGVYLTEYDGLPAAIKLVPCDPAAAGELLAQWETASRWSHPHLLKIFAAGHSLLDKIYVAYVVMELAEDDLSHVLSERKLTEQEARDTLRPVLAALAYLHQQGFVHGRVKPSNVMAVGPAGTDAVKLSTDRSIRGGDPAGDLHDLAALIGDMLPSPLAAPFGEIARHCLNPDPLERWTIPMLETRLAAKSVWAARAAAAASSQAALSITSLPQTPPAAASPPRTFAPDESAEKRAQRVEAAREYLARKAAAQESVPRKSSLRKFIWMGAAVAAVLIATFALRLGRTSGDVRVPEPVASQAANPAASSSASPASSPAASLATANRATPPQAPSASAKEAPGRPEEVKPAPAKEVPRAPEQPPKPQATSAAGSAPAANTAVMTRVLPEFSKSARDSIRGRVRINVRVDVDAQGNVTGASLDPPAASRYFSERTLAASRRWKFRPNGSPRAWVLHYEIFRDDLRVTPLPVK